MFFCKYNDPSYVKVEKLEIMIKLASESNVDTFLSELKELVYVSFWMCGGSELTWVFLVTGTHQKLT